MVIDIDVAAAVRNILLNYAEVHGLPSPVRNVNRVTQSIIFLPAEMSYRSVHCDFLAGLEEESKLRALKYDAFRKLWHQLTSYIQIMSPELIYVISVNTCGMTCNSKLVKKKRPRIY